ncbi:hypothetical protein [Aphanizomenon sp. CS-733/32]|nr:hypothetical protein [Aphanizomenon sp. CS-733/32]
MAIYLFFIWLLMSVASQATGEIATITQSKCVVVALGGWYR